MAQQKTYNKHEPATFTIHDHQYNIIQPSQVRSIPQRPSDTAKEVEYGNKKYYQEKHGGKVTRIRLHISYIYWGIYI